VLFSFEPIHVVSCLSVLKYYERQSTISIETNARNFVRYGN